MIYELLIVDDEYQSRNTLCTCFPWETIGFHVAGQTFNGLEALKFLKCTPVHVVLCDIRMPVMSGIELAKRLTAQPDPPVIIFLSGYRDFEYAHKALKYGVRYYIVKPARYEELYEVFTTLRQELDARYCAGQEILEQEDEDLFLRKIYLYLEKNYRTASLAEAASVLYMNSSYVSQLFKQKTGRNFSDYLMEVRMTKAAKLLENPANKIYDISNQVGYANPKNFARSFRNFFGKTPKEYREGCQFENPEGSFDENI